MHAKAQRFYFKKLFAYTLREEQKGSNWIQ